MADGEVSIVLPHSSDHIDMLQLLSPHFNNDLEELNIIFSDSNTVSLASLSLLCAWNKVFGRNKKIRISDETDLDESFIEIADVLNPKLLSNVYAFKTIKAFLPMMIVNENTQASVSNSIYELIINNHSFQEPPYFLEWPICEIIDNIVNHSKASGFVCARIIKEQFLEIGLWDTGPGLQNTLRQNLELNSDQEAIQFALVRGMRRSPDAGQGNGLAGTFDIIKLNKGHWHICSGETSYQIDTNNAVFKKHPIFKGTGMSIKFDLREEVNLSETFIGAGSWGYLDLVEKELIENHNIIILKNICDYFGARVPARQIRHKVRNLLLQIDSPLTLDFEGISFATSSFLDELLGFLVIELGENEFNKKINVTNMSKQVKSLANVIIKQRLLD